MYKKAGSRFFCGKSIILLYYEPVITLLFPGFLLVGFYV